MATLSPSRVSQPWYPQGFWKDNFLLLLWRTILCILRCLVAPWPRLTWQPFPQLWCLKMSTDIANVPYEAKLSLGWSSSLFALCLYFLGDFLSFNFLFLSSSFNIYFSQYYYFKKLKFILFFFHECSTFSFAFTNSYLYLLIYWFVCYPIGLFHSLFSC